MPLVQKEKALHGEQLGKEELLSLAQEDLEELCAAADEIRQRFCGNRFDLCAIINGKSGSCPENCKYCAQSAHYQARPKQYPLLEPEQFEKDAQYHWQKGVLRYSIVTSGRRLTDSEVDKLCTSYRKIREKSGGICLCASHGLLSYEQFLKLKDAGVTRYHNNLETSRNYFPSICTTHTYEDKLAVIRAAQQAGLEVCSGGIMGLGETMEDRIDMALELRELGIKSVPLNLLNPIPGTPLEDAAPLKQEEILRIIAVYRFALPDAALRLAGGRGLMADKGKKAFQSGANAAITGDMLTTSGIRIEDDIQMVSGLGYEVKLI